MKEMHKIATFGLILAASSTPTFAYAANTLHLREAEQNKCLDIRTQDGATTEGARLQRFTCHNVPEQFWEPILSDLGSTTFALRNPRSGMCVTVDTADFGAQVVQRPCRGDRADQVWVSNGPFRKGSGFHNLRPDLAPGSCLDTLGQFVKIFPCAFNSAQFWELF